MRYKLFVPGQTVGAATVHFDLFNASGSAQTLRLESVKPIPSGAVAATGLVSADVYLTRTSAVGTGGTASTTEGTALDAATISALDNSQPINTKVTARLTPTGGATAGAVLAFRSVYTEEANAGTYTQMEMVGAPIKVAEGTGIRVVQGSVASVGVVAWEVTFCLEPKVL